MERGSESATHASAQTGHGAPAVSEDDLALLRERLELDAAEIDAREEQAALLRDHLSVSRQEV